MHVDQRAIRRGEKKKKIHYRIPSNPNTSLLAGGRSLKPGYHNKGLCCRCSAQPPTEATELEQTDELEEQKGKTVQI